MTSIMFPRLSRHLLTCALRYGIDDEIAMTTIAAVAENYDPSNEIYNNYFDSPWRSLALIFSIANKSDLAHMAFDNAINWFERVLEKDAESMVLCGAHLTMKALCDFQAGKVDRISSKLLRESMYYLDTAMTTDLNSMDFHFLHMNYARLNFLANRYGLEEVSLFSEKEQACYKPNLPVHPTIGFLVEELDFVRRRAILVVEVGDGKAINKTLVRMLSFADLLKRASQEGAWEIGTDLGIYRVLKTYLNNVDLCAPTPSEAIQAVDIVVNFLKHKALQSSQSIRYRAALLLARSIFSPIVGLVDVSEIGKFWQKSIPPCVASAKRLGFAQDILTKQMGYAITDFFETTGMRLCNEAKDFDSQIQTISSLCSTSKNAKIHIKDDGWKTLARVLLKPSKTPRELIKTYSISEATEMFGSELRMRIDKLSLDNQLLIKSHLKTETLVHCNKFFETAVEVFLLPHHISINGINSIMEAAMVYKHAGVDVGTHVWDTAFRCLKSASPSVSLSVLTSWILKNQYLKEKLWTNLESVLELLSEHDKGVPGILSSGVAALMDNHSERVLRFIFGNNHELQWIMLPVVRCVLDSKEQSAVRDVILTWVTTDKGWHFDYERFARVTVDSLLKATNEDVTENGIYDKAARQLIARRIATLNTRDQPRLIPIAIKFLEAQVMSMSRKDIEQQLPSEDNSVETICINLIEAARELSDKDAFELLEILIRDAACYSYSEFFTVHNIAIALLARESIRHKLEKDLNEEQRNSMSQVLIRWLSPVEPIRQWSSLNWSSRSGSSPDNPLSHDEVFTSCRHLLMLLLQSSTQTANDALNALAHWNCTSIWGLARWLAEIRLTAEQSSTTAEALSTTCRPCLEAILTSKCEEMTFSFHGERKGQTVWWREKSDLPATVADIILPHILEHAVDIISSLPEEFSEYNERRQVLCSTVPVLESAGVLAPLCANLIARALDMDTWGDERTLCIAFIKDALQIDSGNEIIGRAIELKLESTSSKKLWTEDRDAVSLLCGLSGAIGDRFTKLYYKLVTPTEIVNNEKLWESIYWISNEIKSPSDLMARLTEVMNIVQTKASCAPTRGNGIGAWATIISAICSKIGVYKTQISFADALHILEFANMPLFGQRVEELWVESSEENDTTRRVIHKALDDWERVTINLIKEVPDKAKLNIIGVERLLMLRELQVKFQHVNDIINTIAQTDLSLQNPKLIVDCMEVCLRQQDLDGVETLFYHSLATVAKSDLGAATTFLVNAISSFWRLSEYNLSMISLRGVSEKLRAPSHQLSEARLMNIFRLANEKLRREFQNPPDLSLAIYSNSNRIGGY